MCGIVGIIGGRDVAPLLVDALKRLEYRGYDSAGVATLQDGKLDRRRAEGKLGNLESRFRAISVLVTRAGRRTARRPRTMPIRISPAALLLCITASSRISPACARN